MDSIFERVKKIVVAQLDVEDEEVKAESSFTDDLGADSLDLAELVLALEEEFKDKQGNPIEIPDEDAENLLTVQNVVGYIENRGIAEE